MNINIKIDDAVARIDLLVEDGWRKYLANKTPTVATVMTGSAMNIALAPLAFKVIERRATRTLTPQKAKAARILQGTKVGVSAVVVLAGAYELYRQHREKQALEHILDNTVDQDETATKAD